MPHRFLLAHAFVASAVVALWYSTRIVLGDAISFEPEAVILFIGAAGYYDLHVLSYRLQQIKFNDFLAFFWPGLLLLLIASFIAFTTCSPVFLVCSGVSLLMAISYSVPLLNWSGARYRLRELPLLKIAIVGAAYALLTVYVPVMTSDHPVGREALTYMLVQRFVFISCLCIPFEIRDENKERGRGVDSLLNYPKNHIQAVATAVSIACIASAFVMWDMGFITAYQLVTDSATLVVTLAWVFFARSGWSPWIFTYLVDGTMFLPVIMFTLLQRCR